MYSTRRSFLAGTSLGAGALLLGPLVRKLALHAAGTEARPMRFLFVLMPNGNVPSHIQPVGCPLEGRDKRRQFTAHALDQYQLAPSLRALEPYKKRVTILQGLSGTSAVGTHSKGFGALGAYRSQNSSAPAATIDAALGKKLGGLFTNVCLGVSKDPTTSVVFDLSASGPGQKVPTICRPDIAFKTLFGSVAGGKAAQEFAVKTNVLDFMAEDVKKLESRVAGPERSMLEAHLHAYEAMRDRQAKLTGQREALAKAVPPVTAKFTSKATSERLSAQFDLAAATLIGGLSRVVTISAGCGEQFAQFTYPELGMSATMHNYGHSDDRETFEHMGKFRAFLLENVAGVMKKLEAVPEDGGTMLDNTLVVFTSDFGGAHHGGSGDWPFILVGTLGGRLKAGRVLTYPSFGVKGHRAINNLYTTFLHAAGVECKVFGTPDVKLKDLEPNGPLSELMA